MADVIITPASGLIDFQNTSGISSATIQLDGNGNLALSAAGGDIQIGDTSSDIFIGDGINNVDIIFEEDGEIRGLTGKTITLGQSDSFISFAGDITGNISVTGTVDGRDIASDGSKLDGIESGATADQTAAEILTLIKTVDGAGSGLDADTVDGISSASFLRSDANDTFTGNLANNGNNYITFGPNSTWSRYLRVGGNGYQGNTTTANIATTNGNLHLDAADGSFASYLNFYAGIAGVAFGNGNNGVVAWMGPDGDLWKGSTDNTGSKYWHAGNDGSGSGLDADTLDGNEASAFLTTSDTTVVKTTGNQSIAGTKTFTGIPVFNGGTSGSSAPFTVDSTQVVTNLNADLLDGISSASFLRSDASDTYSSGTLTFGTGTALDLATNDVYASFRVFRNSKSGSDGLFMGYGNNNSGLTRIYGGGSTSTHLSVSSSGMTFGGSTVWHAGNDGAGSGLDADLLDGAQPSVSASNSTIVQRHSSGYIYANYFNTTPNDVTSGVTKVLVETGNDGFMRHGTADAIRSFINVESGATADQTASEILTAIKTVDGAGSGLDADLLDGISSASFLRSDANDTATGSYLFNRNNAAITNTSYAQGNNHIELRTTNASNPILGFHRSGYTATALYHSGYGSGSLRMRNADGNDGPIFSTFNDGAGSGLDADLWDGNQFATYLNQAVLTTSSPSFNQVITTNNGNGTNVRIGDDAWIGDINAANTIRVQGVQNGANGYIVFGNSNTTALGRAGTGALTYGGSTIWHAGNDGAGSGLDADTVDGTQLSNLMTLSGTQTITGTKTFTGITQTNQLRVGSTTGPTGSGNGTLVVAENIHINNAGAQDNNGRFQIYVGEQEDITATTGKIQFTFSTNPTTDRTSALLKITVSWQLTNNNILNQAAIEFMAQINNNTSGVVAIGDIQPIYEYRTTVASDVTFTNLNGGQCRFDVQTVVNATPSATYKVEILCRDGKIDLSSVSKT